MSAVSWLRRPSALLVAATSLFSVSVWTQTQPTPPPQTPHDRVEAAHEDLTRSGADRARDTARLTAAVAPAIDPAAATAPAPRRNFIDTLVFSRLADAQVPHAPLATDAEFARRVYLDVTGLPPSSADVRAFVADTAADKRDRLIDRLLASDEFAEQWAWHWGDLLRMSGEAGPGANAFHYWFKEQLKVDRPYDRFVHDVLTPSAKVHATIPSLAIIGRSNQLKSRFVESVDDYRISNRLDHIDALTIDVSRVFLGINTSCISCHDGRNHLEDVNKYLAERKRHEFFAMSAFFGTTRLIGNWNDKSRNVDRDLHVDDLGRGYDGGDDAPFLTLAESQFPRPKRSHEPAFILTGEKPRPGFEPRAELARMITGHPQFARATVNIIWGRLMSVGFVEPHDAFDMLRLSGNDAQPTNVELLEALAADFTTSGFRLKHTIRTILQSSTYQLSSAFPGVWKDDYIPLYPRHYARVLTGPEVLDAVSVVTGVPLKFTLGGEPMTRVKQLATPQDIGRGGEAMAIDALLQSFFQSNRRTPPQSGNRPSTLQALLMMKSNVVNDRVLASARGSVAALVESTRTDDEVIDELYMSTSARTPSPSERSVARRTLGAGRARGTEDLLWALLNSPEFLVNR